jgi:hypothetical protein
LDKHFSFSTKFFKIKNWFFTESANFGGKKSLRLDFFFYRQIFGVSWVDGLLLCNYRERVRGERGCRRERKGEGAREGERVKG